LGRDPTCQIKFDKFKELMVSSVHAEINEISEGEFQINVVSRNGCVVNGIPTEGAAMLPNHSTIQLGKDGPRIRFDVDQNVGGISKGDVQKQKTAKFAKKTAEDRAPAPDTEERPVFKIDDEPRGMPGRLAGRLAAAGIELDQKKLI